ncbi:MAG: hypothetical protein LJE66_08430 [Desulfobacterales bacterium]|jgi:glycogen debranching enzyme|nr:hypothetical protein [Desulfobacterales bacterium]
MTRTQNDEKLMAEGYRKAMDLLGECSRPEGFLASPTDDENYRRIWGRDSVIIGLAALLTEDKELHDTFKRSLETLARHQGPHGEIPSNVDPKSQRVSFGGMAGRVDADLWFVIGCGEYWKATGDRDFIGKMLPVIEKVRFLLGAWQFNNRGLLYIPATGDWADEYLHNGYVLYDQLLYLQVLRTIGEIRTHWHDSHDHRLDEQKSRLKHLIRDNYWFTDDADVPDDVYHDVIYQKGKKIAAGIKNRYWMSFFSPHGYGYRFDALANIFASLFDVADEGRRRLVDRYIEQELADEKLKLVPAFHPVITPVDKDWEELHIIFSYHFKNRPYEYHNGGLWPMITGFYVADLSRRGLMDAAREYLIGIHRANRMDMEGEAWGFPEYVHGKEHTPGGTRHQGWSAAAAVIGHNVLKGKEMFRIHG